MAAVPTHGHILVPRTEWAVWKLLHSRRATLPRMPNFGDYGIQHPNLPEGFDPRFMQVAPSIRYAGPDEWIILKGQSTKVSGAAVQYPLLATKLMGMPEYCGSGHCDGSACVDKCSSNTAGLGSLEAWRRIGAIHHITVSVEELAQMPFP